MPVGRSASPRRACSLATGCASAPPATEPPIATSDAVATAVSPQPSVAVAPVVVDPACHFPAGTTAAWWAETSLRSVNLQSRLPSRDLPGAGPDDKAMVYVTVERIYLYVGPSGTSQQQAPVRAYCAVYPAGAGGDHPV